MARIEGFRVKNFKVLKEVTLGRLWHQRDRAPLTPMSAVIGKNGVGKSALFDVFGFLADALRLGVEDACDARGRGGFPRLHTQGTDGPIAFELYYRERPGGRPITYEIEIEDTRGRPCVTYERLRQRRRGQRHGRPFTFLWLLDGAGIAWKGEQDAGIADEPENFRDYLESLEHQEESKDREWVELTDQSRRNARRFEAAPAHRRVSPFHRGWHLSPDEARGLPLAGERARRQSNVGNTWSARIQELPRRSIERTSDSGRQRSILCPASDGAKAVAARRSGAAAVPVHRGARERPAGDRVSSIGAARRCSSPPSGCTDGWRRS